VLLLIHGSHGIGDQNLLARIEDSRHTVSLNRATNNRFIDRSVMIVFTPSCSSSNAKVTRNTIINTAQAIKKAFISLHLHPTVSQIYQISELNIPNQEGNNTNNKQQYTKYNTSSMCSRVDCRNCGKASWVGCGMHVSCVMWGIPEEERCPNWKKGASYPCGGK